MRAGCYERARKIATPATFAFSATGKGRDSARSECAEKFCVTVQECSCAQTADKEIRGGCFRHPGALNWTAINVS